MTNDALIRPAPEHLEDRPNTAAGRLLLGGPVVLVTTMYRGQENVMPVAWHMPVSVDPPLVAIAVEQSRHTADLIRHAQEFALNFPTRPLLHHVQYLGALLRARVRLRPVAVGARCRCAGAEPHRWGPARPRPA